ncbi:uncharacterized protein LOC106163283 isoform X2 [Lingula anatina]|uniref:receptor protein-tyrosine kinase n=1 Tax=Lingula anatina TaxID=7574 RepID=A0A1S3IFN5_LINAN|nr:uncharacterized protein LOC106163283 isoform X2 [Lingula anatina]|eukprot:XP_013396279.1 uncharacterized protein LOC106163283 isoform X2 [Lingula anatina]
MLQHFLFRAALCALLTACIAVTVTPSRPQAGSGGGLQGGGEPQGHSPSISLPIPIKCKAQCIADCLQQQTDTVNRSFANCGATCTRILSNQTREEDCSGSFCEQIQHCLVQEVVGIIPSTALKPEVTSLTPYNQLVRWNDANENLGIFIVGFKYGTIEKHYITDQMEYIVKLNELLLCQQYSVRIFAVTGFERITASQPTIFSNKPIPGTVGNLTIGPLERRSDQYVYGFFQWTPPEGWKSSDISYYRYRQSAVNPGPPLIIANNNFNSHQTELTSVEFRVLSNPVKPKFTDLLYIFQVTPVASCAELLVGATANITLNFSVPRYPGRVNLSTVTLHSVPFSNSEILVAWQPPETNPAAVERYELQWGPVDENTGNPLQHAMPLQVEGSASLGANHLNKTITVREPHRKYGIEIAALGRDEQPEWNFLLYKPFEPFWLPLLEPEGNRSYNIDGGSAPNPIDDRLIPDGNIPLFPSSAPISPRPPIHRNQSVPRESPAKSKPNQTASETDSKTLIIIVPSAMGGFVLLFLACSCARCYQKRLKKMKTKRTGLYDHNIVFSIPGMVDNENYASVNIQPPVRADQWEISKSRILFGEVLGEGAFGMVYKGYVTGHMHAQRLSSSDSAHLERDQNLTVAVKVCHEFADDGQKTEFLKEICLMKALGHHQHIVSLIGCCTLEQPLCLIVEHMSHGDLLHYLKAHRMNMSQGSSEASRNTDIHVDSQESIYPSCGVVEGETLSYSDLLSFGRQIAVGMEYLSQKGYVHRDLATRNVLIGEGKNVKIGDFGLTRYIYDDKIYCNRKGGKLPLKWMSIEAIFDLTFSTASDVWAYGVVLFELVTLGGTPYPTIANKDLLKELQNGYRMEKPDNCTDELYDVMMLCWQEDMARRPSFTQLRNTIEQMMESMCSDCYLDLNIDSSKDYYTMTYPDDLNDPKGQGHCKGQSFTSSVACLDETVCHEMNFEIKDDGFGDVDDSDDADEKNGNMLHGSNDHPLDTVVAKFVNSSHRPSDRVVEAHCEITTRDKRLLSDDSACVMLHREDGKDEDEDALEEYVDMTTDNRTYWSVAEKNPTHGIHGLIPKVAIKNKCGMLFNKFFDSNSNAENNNNGQSASEQDTHM